MLSDRHSARSVPRLTRALCCDVHAKKLLGAPDPPKTMAIAPPFSMPPSLVRPAVAVQGQSSPCRGGLGRSFHGPATAAPKTMTDITRLNIGPLQGCIVRRRQG